MHTLEKENKPVSIESLSKDEIHEYQRRLIEFATVIQKRRYENEKRNRNE